MRFLHRHRRILTAAAVFAVCLLVFAVFWQLDVRGTADKSRGAYLNDVQDTTTAPVKTSIEQTFVCDVPFYKLGLLPSFKGQELGGFLILTVYDGAGNQLADPVEGKAAETVSGQYAVFSFPQALQSPDGVYRLVFEAEMYDPEDEFALVKSADALDGWTLVENGRPAGGSLCILVTVDVIGGFVSRFYWVFALLACLAMGGIALLAQRREGQVHVLFALCAALLGLLCCLVLPPYDAPDEEAHINRAFNLSSGLMGQTDGPVPPGTVVRRAGDNDVVIQENGTTVFTYRELARQALTRTSDPTPTTFEGESATGAAVLYLPGVLGLTLARLLGLGLVPALYLGRLFNLAVYVLLGLLAVKLTPTRKGLLAVAGLLPLSVHLGASYNPTGLVLAAALLGVGLCLRGFHFKGKPVPEGIPFGIFSGLILLYVVFGHQSTQMSIQVESLQNLLKTLFGGLLGDYNLSLNWGFTLAALVLLAFTLLPEPQDTPLGKSTRLWLVAPALVGFAIFALTSGFTLQAAVLALPLLPALLAGLSSNWGGIVKKRNYTPFLICAFSGIAVFSLLDCFLLTLTR